MNKKRSTKALLLEIGRLRAGNRRLFWDAIGLFIVCTVLFLLILFNPEPKIPENLGSTYYDQEGNIWVRLNASDPKQIVLAKQIEIVCEFNNFEYCKSAAARLGYVK